MPESPPFVRNAANPKQVKEAGRKVKDTDIQFALDLESVMETVHGRRVIAWLLEFCGEDQLSYTGNSDTYFREGSRNVALALKAKLKGALPKLYLKMLEEKLIREQPTEPPEEPKGEETDAT